MGLRPRVVKSALQRYGITLLATSLAFAVTLSVQHLFPYPFLFLFFGALMVSAWFGGKSAGLFAVLLSTLLVDYFFVPPHHSFAINATAEGYFAAFVACALAASWVSSSKRRAEEGLTSARDQLEIRVAERTAELQKSNDQLQERERQLRLDIEERHRAEEALKKTQSELAHLLRVLTMAELTASIAHELNQPLAAVVANGDACVEWLAATPPNLLKARQTAEKIVQDGARAGEVLTRIRALFKKELPAKGRVDMNGLIQDLIVSLRDEAGRRHIELRSDLAPALPEVMADRVQMQQVVLNLITNSMEAMDTTATLPKQILIGSRQESASEIAVRIEDCGAGLDSNSVERIFHPFFSTKPQGIGMGLSICRSIIEAHEGRLSASPRAAGGTVFQFTIPICSRNADD